jgi:hypothetical protein
VRLFVVTFVLLMVFVSHAYCLPEPVLPVGLVYNAQIAWGPEAGGLVWVNCPVADFRYGPGTPGPHDYDTKHAGPSNTLWWGGVPPEPYSTLTNPCTVAIGIRIDTIPGPVSWIGFYRARFQAVVYDVEHAWSDPSDWTLVTDLSQIPFLELLIHVGKSFVTELLGFS